MDFTALAGPITYKALGVAFGVSSIAVSIVLWAFAKFQTKREASVSNRLMRLEMEKLETQVGNMQSNLARIGENVSYIRGRLEPKPK